MTYRILIFSWNTESISICETTDTDVAKTNRSGWLTTWRYPCEIADFFQPFKEKILSYKPDIIVIGFQEDRKPGSYFHSHLLPEEMPKIGYKLVNRNRLMGVGITTVKGIKQADPFERGLRMSVYVTEEIEPVVKSQQSEYVCSSAVTRSKGAIACYLNIEGIAPMAFICCHLPFDAKSIVDERIYKNKMLRQNQLNYANICFNNIIEELVLFRKDKPTHVVLFGDLNYRINLINNASTLAKLFVDNEMDREFIKEIYQNNDEFLQQMRKENIYKFLEGVNDEGPIFLPTCKMVKGRDESTCSGGSCWKTGKLDHRNPSWCDRIIYNRFVDDEQNLICTYYNRFEAGLMNKSDHSGVIAIYDLI